MHVPVAGPAQFVVLLGQQAETIADEDEGSAAVIAWMRGRERNGGDPAWEGTTTELHSELTRATLHRSRYWPETPISFGKRLSTVVAPLREAGVDISKPSRSSKKRTLRITARYADHWNFVGGPPEEFARKRDVLAAHCADVGRDPKDIMLSAHVRLNPERDYDRVIDQAAALGAEGLDMAIVYLPPPYDPAVLEPLAERIRESGLASKDS